jgi:dipeptidyl aminopeptidase/acylaminoacyl peptidase
MTFLALLLAAALPWFAPPTTTVIRKPVTFANQGATFHGTLYLPVADRPVPAVVVYHGASEPLATTPLYQHLSEGITQLGIAVLLFDRRGSGASSGKNDVPYETLADDGIAGANALRTMPQIDPARVGYWGISQGGWLTTFAAERDKRAAFAVAVSAPLTSPESQMEFADANHLYALGYTKTDIDDMLAARKMWTGYLRGANTREQAVFAIAKIQGKPWYQYMYMPTVAQLKGPAESEWRTQMDDDPLVAVKTITVPTLFILGSSDPWIPVAETAASLRAVSAKHPNISYAVIPDANHLMMVPPQKELMADASPQAVLTEVPASPAYFMLLGSWLARTLARP